MSHAIIAIIEAERDRQHRRVQGAEEECKRLRGAPIPASDGDEVGAHGPQLDRARQLDRAERELDRANAAAEALRALGVRIEEEQATERPEDMDRAMVRGR
jgi:hypothetical protein